MVIDLHCFASGSQVARVVIYFVTTMDMKRCKSSPPSIFDCIPLETLVRIFRFCKSTRAFFLVNKTWNWCAEIAFDPSVNDNFAILYASASGYIESVKKLLKDKRVDPAARRNAAIQRASSNGHLEMVKELIADKRVNPSDGFLSAFQWACQDGRLEVVKFLLQDKRVDPSADCNFAIRLAKKYNNTEVVTELLKDPRVGIF